MDYGMRRFAPAILAGLLCVFFAQAATAASSSPMLGEILNKTEANYSKIQAFTATFRQQTTSSAAGTVTPAEAHGRLYYAKPRQVRWEYDKPEEQVFVANDKHAWLYVPAEKQISLFDAGNLFASPLARTFFDGAVGLKNHFDITLDAGQSNKKAAVLKLVPKKDDPSIKLLSLWINLQDYRIYQIESKDILGNTNRIALDSFTPRPSLDTKLFQFDVPPSAKVFDAEGREFSKSDIEQLRNTIGSGR
ncbi:MAG: outer membrane lipoprotein carrier protein LolA [Desulfobacteraceae bacterium]|nr:outer membrane lipoprotein carrier protein LolA [Desulfobacteraceae bacterium]